MKFVLPLIVIVCMSCTTAKPNVPPWVSDPYYQYNDNTITVKGRGFDRESAERDGLRGLVLYIQAQVWVDERVLETNTSLLFDSSILLKSEIKVLEGVRVLDAYKLSRKDWVVLLSVEREAIEQIRSKLVAPVSPWGIRSM